MQVLYLAAAAVRRPCGGRAAVAVRRRCGGCAVVTVVTQWRYGCAGAGRGGAGPGPAGARRAVSTGSTAMDY
jgi:hypothetical protein